MKTLITTFSIVLGIAGAAHADHIGIYADQVGFDCSLSPLVMPPGNNAAYVIHKFNVGSTASEFVVTDTSGLFATTQTFPAGYLTVGTWNTNLSIAYGGCVIGDHVIATLNFLWFGIPATCNQYLAIRYAPLTPILYEVVVVDCAQPTGNLETATAGTLYLASGCFPCELAAEESTWGSVKALYR